MREIRFRVWDIGNDRMVYDPDRFEPAYSPDEKEISDWTFYETWRDIEDGIKRSCHVMQFTGLKDKNGKDVFESDVINIFAGNKHDIVKGLHEILWRLSGWYIEPIDGSEYTDVDNSDLALYNYVQACEVVGNIYENPELLKQV